MHIILTTVHAFDYTMLSVPGYVVQQLPLVYSVDNLIFRYCLTLTSESSLQVIVSEMTQDMFVWQHE